MPRAGLNADLAEVGLTAEGECQLLHVGNELTRGRVLLPDLPDLPTDGHHHTRGLVGTDEVEEVGRPLGVKPLLLAESALAQVHQRGGVHVDVVDPGIERLEDEILDHPHLISWIGGELARLDLEVVTLDEHRAGPPSRDRCGENGRCVLA